MREGDGREAGQGEHRLIRWRDREGAHFPGQEGDHLLHNLLLRLDVPLMAGGVGQWISHHLCFQHHRPDQWPEGVIQRAVKLFLSIFTQHSMMRLAECLCGAVAGDFQLVTFKGQHFGQVVTFLSQLTTGHALDMAAFQLIGQQGAPGTESGAPGAGIAAVVLLQLCFLLLRAGDGRQGVLHPAGLFKMGRSGCGQSLQRRFQVIRDKGGVGHGRFPRGFNMR
ncbi:Uncharacterised protein [Klebsiella pneumoniae]|nr:hypothetical protein MTE2_5473 [Klebsiella pneumoniae VA360]KUF48657.1 hypothetical protein AOT25_04721 [Klebsiella pneumoniae]SVK12388.1 Uncharacterised protein [Klebsiella pneumoniae]SVK84247.1 Uncharacterised protein [Klebsiella pneumoniae]SVM77606.1 Uncharacterised protein [Klebsiella pneumoniae]